MKDTNSRNKTAKELADMVAERIGIGGVLVAVHHDQAYGWHPTVVTKPAQAVQCQGRAEEIAAELRASGYKLKA